MNTEHEFDFAISYAGPDQAFVEEVVAALKARGFRVFFAPDEQAELIGRNLLDCLSEVYLSKARFCLLFASKHYAERKWTDRVERPAAQERASDQVERYIIPIRLDETKITGLSRNTADIRNATPKRVADLCVAVFLRDEKPAAVTDDAQKRDRLVLRVNSFTEFDVDLLKQTFKPFAGWVAGKAHLIPVELRLPAFLLDTLSAGEGVLKSPEVERLDSRTHLHFFETVKMIRTDLFGELLRAPSAVLASSQPDGSASLVLTDNAIELIRRYVLAKVIAAARCLATWCLKGFPGPPWAQQFADCHQLYSPTLMGGLPWLCRSEGSERHLWLNADINGWGPGKFRSVRVYLPSVMVIAASVSKPASDDVMRFLAPQLLERDLKGEQPLLLHDAFAYPERIELSLRSEIAVESHHFHEVDFLNSWEKARPAMESLRDEILKQYTDGALERRIAAERLASVGAILGHNELFSDALDSILRGPPSPGRAV